MIKLRWALTESGTAVRHGYGRLDESGSGHRSHGNENWEFATNWVVERRIFRINEVPIKERAREFDWLLGHHLDVHPQLSSLSI
ncbi:hypothetical protein C1922_18760 [Stenotrophomonas sp. ZAC14D2_NAIMI4_7]|nr:hypothetical protein C1922_18760 [Stenotrophomonas sp. ZAC14D2_NAIMI4_7]